MNYKGEKGKLYGVRFSHIYESSGFRYTGFCADKDLHPKPRHACLKYGYWCWSNAFQNPVMAIKYLIKKYLCKTKLY